MSRLPRWAALLAVPLLAAAVLVMHGADAASGHAAAAGPEEHAGAGHDQHEGECTSCVVSHLLVACVAVITTVAAVAAARRHLGGGSPVVPRSRAPRARRVRDVLLRPPEPAWVRLSVMRC